MRAFIFLILMMLLGSTSLLSQPAPNPINDYAGPTTAGFWLYPFMDQAQADQMAGYSILILHNELFYKQSPMIDRIISKNPSIKLLVYFNPIEHFVPPYEDSPWAIKMVKELNQGERKNWWLLQPNGKPITFWTGTDGRQTNLMDMRINSALVDNELYCEYIAKQFNNDILRNDKRIAGIEIDNAWPNSFWLSRYGTNKGVDFDRNGKADTDSQEIDRSWQAGENRFIKLIREIKGDDFIMISNPGTLAFNIDLNGKILENWPFQYAGDTTNDGWNISMFNAARTGPYTILNARPGNWFFTLCSAMLLDNVCFSDVQNAPYKERYKIYLGKPLEAPSTNFKKNLSIYSRKYEKGTVYVNPKQKISWIEDINGKILYNKEAQYIR